MLSIFYFHSYWWAPMVKDGHNKSKENMGASWTGLDPSNPFQPNNELDLD